jgi:hypothetical protein
MNDAQVDRIVRAINAVDGGSYDLWYLIALVFIASYLGWIALRLRQINETLQAIKRVKQGIELD